MKFLLPAMVLFALSSVPGTGQTLETLIAEDEGTERNELIEQLDLFRSSPISLNTAGRADLSAFPLLTIAQIDTILKERDGNGPFLSWSDFVERTGFERDTWSALLPCFTIDKRVPARRLAVRLRASHAWPEELSSRFSAPPGQLTLRILGSMKSVQLGLLMERDAYEPRWPDHAAGFLQGEFGRWRITCGQFGVRSGLGLTLSEPYGSGRGDYPRMPSGMRCDIRGHASAEENHYFNGLAAEYKSETLRGFAFLSRHFLDARTGGTGAVTSFPADGLHRSTSELDSRKSLREEAAAMGLKWVHGSAHIGVTAYACRYARPVLPQDTERAFFGFRGRALGLAGLDYGLTFRTIEMNGELSVSVHHGTGWIQAFGYSLRRMSCVVSFRVLSPGFANPHGYCLAERSPSNMTGVYAGFTVKPGQGWKLEASLDLVRRPWRTWSNPLPSTRHTLICRLERRATPRIELIWRHKQQRRSEFSGGVLRDEWNRAWRMEMRLLFTNRLSLKNRLELLLYRPEGLNSGIKTGPENEKGLLFYQHLGFRLLEDMEISVRWTCFSSDSYDSRVYQFEDNCPGMFSSTPLYGQGFRLTFFAKAVLQNALFTLKYGYTRPLRSVQGDSGITLQMDITLHP